MIKLEDYECDNCGADTTFTDFHCGVCPHNGKRIEEYNKKYNSNNLNYKNKRVIDLSRYVSD